jgi:hypothetical protein
MSSIGPLREALAVNLSAIPDVQVSAYILANPTPPTLQIVPGGVVYDQAMGRGHDDVTFTVQAIVALTTDVGGQKRLDRFVENLAPYSVKAAI